EINRAQAKNPSGRFKVGAGAGQSFLRVLELTQSSTPIGVLESGTKRIRENSPSYRCTFPARQSGLMIELVGGTSGVHEQVHEGRVCCRTPTRDGNRGAAAARASK